MSKHWTLQDIHWEAFDASCISPSLIAVIKASSLVEYNAHDYETYLSRVFADHEEVKPLIHQWAMEEIQHGEALAKWAKLADPEFDFEHALKTFREGYQIPLDVEASVRGSQTGEMIARCVVEIGTSSFYTALKDGVKEPVLKEIAQKIAADELRHYKLFYNIMQEFAPKDQLNLLQRMQVGWQRFYESGDDELAFAYYAANDGGIQPYERKVYMNHYARQAYPFYQPHHIERIVLMSCKAVGLKPYDIITQFLSSCMYRYFRFRIKTLEKKVA